MSNRGFGNKGYLSTANSVSDQTIANGGNYTGSWESVIDYASIAITFTATGVGTLYLRFSDTADGATVRQTIQLSNGVDSTSGIHGAIASWPYIQVYFTNDSGSSIDLTLVTVLHQSSKISIPTSRLETPYNRYSDVLNTRVANDINLDTNRGGIAGHETVHNFGENPDIVASTTENIAFNSVLVMPSSASTVRIKSGGSTSDTAAGAGATEVTVEGLDENWESASEAIATNGSSASSATTTTFRRVFRAYVSGFGTVFTTGTAGGNVGNIEIETTGGTVVVTIPSGKGQTLTSLYTVPAGYTAYLTRAAATVESNKASDVRMWQRPDADDVTTPVRGRRLITEFEKIIGYYPKVFNSWPSFTEKTDLWATGTAPSGNSSAISFEYDLTLVKNT